MSNIASSVNKHKHTKTCRKYNTVCRFNFPKLPSYTTLITRPLPSGTDPETKARIGEEHQSVKRLVRTVLADEKQIQEIYEMFKKEEEGTNYDAAIHGRNCRIDELLKRAGLEGKEGRERYERALMYSPAGCQIVPARDLDEFMVNSYNPELTRAWNGNTDFQICLDLYAVVGYITDYYAKDDTGLSQES